MFSVSKVFTFLLLPPGLFLLLSLIILLLLFLSLRQALRQEKRKTGTASRKAGTRLTRTAAILTALLAAGLYILSIEPVSELLLRPLEQAHPPLLLGEASIDQNSFEADAIVVL